LPLLPASYPFSTSFSSPSSLHLHILIYHVYLNLYVRRLLFMSLGMRAVTEEFIT
jgi:hypothetical protein